MSRLPQSLAGVRVLVVDDSVDERQMLAFALELHGAEVVTAASVERALDVIADERPDVLVSDVCLPRADGFRLIEAVRRRSPGAGGRIPAIAMAGWSAPSDHGRAIDAGFQVFLRKPIALDTLVAVISSLARNAAEAGVAPERAAAAVGRR
jgi:CheY-like chemotaxis protein